MKCKICGKEQEYLACNECIKKAIEEDKDLLMMLKEGGD